jgi:hypothetical protein
VKELGALVGLVFIVIVLIMFGCNVRGIAPTPEQYAAATATVQRAVDESVRYQKETQATVTYLDERMRMLPVQVQNDVDADNRAVQARAWGLAGGIAVALLIGLAIAAFIRIRAQFIPRGKDGQMPVRALGDATVDLHRAIGAGVAVQNPSPLDHLWHLVRGTPLPAPRFVTTDAGVSPDQLLLAAQSANQATSVAALMRPGNTAPDRSSRLQLVKQGALRDPYGNTVKPGSTSVVVDGDAVLQIANQIGVAFPTPEQPAEIVPPAELPMIGGQLELLPHKT